ncbi:hypothetical protein BJX70DRAFT_347783 [Aspergillus crustosus]
MKSFSSSAINKSGKKFAPKAPIRRTAPTAPAPPRAPSRRASVASQTSVSHPPPTASETATSEPPNATAPAVEPAASTESTVSEAPAVVTTTENATESQPITAIPIPRPKRKSSVPVPILRPTKDVSTVSQSSPPGTTATTESIAHDESGERDETKSNVVQVKDKFAILTVAGKEDEAAPEARPAKRPRTAAAEAVPSSILDKSLDETIQLVTPPITQTSAARERTQSRDESKTRRTEQGSLTKPGSRRASRSTSNDTGKAQKKEKKQRNRKREPTPEGAEQIEIRPSVVKMSDLCKDMRTGKRSKRETELRAHELAEAERKRAQQEEDRQDGTPVKQTPTDASPAEGENANKVNQTPQAGPVMRIVNGEIVLDAASLQVDRHADAEKNGGDLEDVVENSLTRKINQSTYGKRSKTESWDEDMTDLFYRGLRMFGTDFMVISKMFPGRSRRQIKLKFNNEERRDPQRIKETLLGPRESIDINTYSEMTNTVYDDPRVIQQELDEEKRLIEEQHEKDKKAQEDQLRNPDGLGGNNTPGPDKVATKAKRNNKNQTLRDAGGGTEEILGSIDD